MLYDADVVDLGLGLGLLCQCYQLVLSLLYPFIDRLSITCQKKVKNVHQCAVCFQNKN